MDILNGIKTGFSRARQKARTRSAQEQQRTAELRLQSCRTTNAHLGKVATLLGRIPTDRRHELVDSTHRALDTLNNTMVEGGGKTVRVFSEAATHCMARFVLNDTTQSYEIVCPREPEDCPLLSRPFSNLF